MSARLSARGFGFWFCWKKGEHGQSSARPLASNGVEAGRFPL
jgi:hypothetical protein